MWNRAQLKQKGKDAFRKNYMPSVLVALLGMITANVTITIGQGAVDNRMRAIFAIGGGIAFLITVFLSNVIEVGVCGFFIKNRTSEAKTGEVFLGFKSSSYFNIVLVQLLRNLKIFLWSLLFIIPGIVKMYEYRMIPFIMAENPTLDQREAFRLSKRMMDGRKLELFILDLSFIGWLFLSALSFGLIGILYANPYIQATQAEVYEYNKNSCNGYDPEEWID